MPHILAATDLSPLARDALARARLVAGSCDADLTVLHALGSDLTSPLRDLLGDDLDDQAARAIPVVREKLGPCLDPVRPGRTVDLVVEPGQPGTVVPAYARGTEADLVVLGARGSGTLRRILFGSTAAHLLRQSDVPTLVVRKPAEQHYRRVLVAVDRSPASLRLLEVLDGVAPHAERVLVHVARPDADPGEGLAAWAAANDVTGELHEVTGDPAERILELTHDLDCDLVAMGKHGTRASEERTLGSVTKTVVETGCTDTLVLVDPQRPR